MNSNRYEISKYRLERSKEDLDSAKDELENNKLKASVNRSYYSIFHAIRSVNAIEGFDSKKHSGVIEFFRLNFIKTNKFDVMCSKWIDSAFRIRNNADYEDFYIVYKEDAEKQLENASKFLLFVEKYLEKVWQHIE